MSGLMFGLSFVSFLGVLQISKDKGPILGKIVFSAMTLGFFLAGAYLA